MEIDNKLIAIKIWDTAGQEKFASVAKSYYQRAHGMIVTCAINNRKSFSNLKNWLYSIKENNSNENLPIIIVANKFDLENEREVKKEEIICLAKEWGVEAFETSAQDGYNVDEAFDKIINLVYSSLYKKVEGFKIEENVKNIDSEEKNNCCKS